MGKREMLEALRSELKSTMPNLKLDSRKARLLLRWKDNDYFNIYFSNQVPDGLRIGFVLDLDEAHSERRLVFEETLLSEKDRLEDTFGASVVLRQKDSDVVKEHDWERWIKLCKHRWYSLYLMLRCRFRLALAVKSTESCR